jgi:glucosyl-dolichyl phosphate glucuronosyltransferase
MLTVLLPTFNGEDTIGRTLEAMSKLIPPAGGWQLVLVNNGSTDRTQAIIDQWMPSLPLKLVWEERLGKPVALNTGLEWVQGDFVVMTDDDVIPDPNWLVEWRRIADQYPQLDVFGGSIVPEFEVPPPEWLVRANWSIVLYAATALDREEGVMAPDEMDVYGPNMAVRSSVIHVGLRFDSRLMKGPSALMGEDTEFVDRAVAEGLKVGFAPTACVRHIVNAQQVTWRWMLKRFYRHGRTMAFFDVRQGKAQAPRVFSIPRYLIRRLAERAAALPLVAASRDEFRLISHLRLIAYDLGAARQARLRMSVSKPSSAGKPERERRVDLDRS